MLLRSFLNDYIDSTVFYIKVNLLKTPHYPITSNLSMAIHNYTRQVDEVYQNEGCSSTYYCSDDIILDKIVANPIYCYQVKSILHYIEHRSK